MKFRKTPILRSHTTLTLPDFSQLTPHTVGQAAKDGLVQLTENLIALRQVPATVADFLEPLDEAFRRCEQACAPAFNLISAVGGSEYDDLEGELAQLYTQVMHGFTTDAELFSNLRALQEQDLDEESRTLVDDLVLRFRLGGAELDPEQQEKLAELSLQISDLAVQYQKRVSQMLANPVTVGAKEYSLNNFTNQLALSSIDDPQLRRELLEASLSRGWGDDPDTDTRQLVLDITRARQQRAELLGFADHVEAVVAQETVPSKDLVRQLLSEVGAAATKQARREAEQLRELAAADGVEDFTAADWLYYQARADQADSAGPDISPTALAPYLELWQVVEDGVFVAANKLYGITMTRRPQLKGWDESCRVYEIHDEDGASLGLFLADYFSRPGKRGGAWMSGLEQGYAGNDYQSIIINCANFTPPAPGEAKYLHWDDVITCFHEFGHALHGILSRTRYHHTAGTSVPRDFVELPSQLNEMWAYHPQIIASFARHAQTGQVMPAQMVQALASSATKGQGYDTSEYCASALLDHFWHSETPREGEDVAQFESRTLTDAGVGDPLVPPRYRSTYFPHAFTVGYDGCYYSYMWAETLVGECEQWFRTVASKDGDGGLNREAGQRYVDEILRRGASRPPVESFRALIGHDASAQAVLRRRGLA